MNKRTRSGILFAIGVVIVIFILIKGANAVSGDIIVNCYDAKHSLTDHELTCDVIPTKDNLKWQPAITLNDYTTDYEISEQTTNTIYENFNNCTTSEVDNGINGTETVWSCSVDQKPKQVNTWQNIDFDKIKLDKDLKLESKTDKDLKGMYEPSTFRFKWKTPIVNANGKWLSKGEWSINPSDWYNTSCNYRVNASLPSWQDSGTHILTPLIIPKSVYTNFDPTQLNIDSTAGAITYINTGENTSSYFMRLAVDPVVADDLVIYYDCSGLSQTNTSFLNDTIPELLYYLPFDSSEANISTTKNFGKLQENNSFASFEGFNYVANYSSCYANTPCISLDGTDDRIVLDPIGAMTIAITNDKVSFMMNRYSNNGTAKRVLRFWQPNGNDAFQIAENEPAKTWNGQSNFGGSAQDMSNTGYTPKQAVSELFTLTVDTGVFKYYMNNTMERTADAGNNMDNFVTTAGAGKRMYIGADTSNFYAGNFDDFVMFVDKILSQDEINTYSAFSNGNWSVVLGSEQQQSSLTFTTPLIADVDYTDLTSGTNYGRSSDSWSVNGEAEYSVTLSAPNTKHYLQLVHTSLDNALDIYIEGTQIGTISADAGSGGDWLAKAFEVNASLVATNPVNLTIASNSGSEGTYIDSFAFIQTTNMVDGNYSMNNTAIAIYSNLTTADVTGEVSYLDILNDTAVVEMLNISKNGETSKINTTAEDSQYIYVYLLPDAYSNMTFQTYANGTGSSNIYGTNHTQIVDNIAPLINTITGDFNVLVDSVYSITINTTETYDYYSQIQMNNGSVFNLTELTTNDQDFNGTIQYPLSVMNTTSTRVYHCDKAGHCQEYNFTTYTATVSHTSNTVPSFNKTITRTSGFNSTTTDTVYDEYFTFDINAIANGTALVTQDEYNVTATISDTYPLDIVVLYSNTTNYSLIDDNITSLTYHIEDFNLSSKDDGYFSFNNTVSYKIDNAIQMKHANTGVNDARLFWLSVNNMSDLSNLGGNIWVHIPLRTAYDSTSSRTIFKECVSGATYGSDSCAQWVTLTTQLENQANTSFHDGSNYPTVDTDGDGNKDELWIKLPELASLKMYQIDLDTSNAESDWTPAEQETDGGGSSAGDSEVKSATASSVGTTYTTSKPNEWWSQVEDFFSKLFYTITGWFTRIQLSEQNTFILMAIITIGGIALLYTGKSKKSAQQGMFYLGDK